MFAQHVQSLGRIFDLLERCDRQALSTLRSMVEDEAEVLLQRSHPDSAQFREVQLLIRNRIVRLAQLALTPATAAARPVTASAAVDGATPSIFELAGLTALPTALHHDRAMVAIEAVRVLFAVDFCDVTVRSLFFVSVLRGMVVDVSPAAQEAAKLLGHVIATIMPEPIVVTVLISQWTGAVEWLTHGSSLRRGAGALVLQQLLAVYCDRVGPSMHDIDGQLRLLVCRVWDPLRDPIPGVRALCADTLRMALSIAREARLQASVAKHCALLLSVCRGLFGDPQPTALHAAILVFQAVLRAANDNEIPLPAGLVAPGFDFIQSALQHPALPKAVMSALFETLPSLAVHDKERFLHLCVPLVERAATAVFRFSARFEERSQMFLVIGRLAESLPQFVPAILPRLVPQIVASLIVTAIPSALTSAIAPGTATRPATAPSVSESRPCFAAASCLTMLAKADSEAVRPYLIPIVDALFSNVPTVGFAHDVKELCSVYPELRFLFLDRMLRLLHEQLQPPAGGRPDRLPHRYLSALESTLALDFSGFSVLDFLVRDVVPRLDDPSAAVRRAAVAACAKLVFSSCSGRCTTEAASGAIRHIGRKHILDVNSILLRLVDVAVADPDSAIRLFAVETLGPTFDGLLASQEACRRLVPTVNDKYPNRQAALRLIGRLSRRNPAAVTPILRKVMNQCTTELHVFSNARKQDQAASLLGTLVEAAPAVAAPYIRALLAGMLLKLNSPETQDSVLTSLFDASSKIALYAGANDADLLLKLRPLVVQHIVHRGNRLEARRRAAVRTLSSVTRVLHQQYVGGQSLFEIYPELFDALLAMLHGGFKESWPMRRDAFGLLGFIGAVDPTRIKRMLSARKDGEQTANAVVTYVDASAMMRLALLEAIDVLNQPSLTDDCCAEASACIAMLFSIEPFHSEAVVPLMGRTCGSILERIRQRASLRARLVEDLCVIVSMLKHHMRGVAGLLLDEVCTRQMFADPAVAEHVLQLLLEIRYSLNEELKPHLPRLLPLIIVAAETAQVQGAVLNCLGHFSGLLGSHLHSVLPCVLELVSSKDRTVSCRALRTISAFAYSVPSSIAEHSPSIVHTVCRVLQEAPREDVYREALTTLNDVGRALGALFGKYRPIVDSIVGLRALDEAQRAPRTLERLDLQPPEPRRRRPTGASKSVPLETLIADAARAGHADWAVWLRRLRLSLLSSSSSDILRVCCSLAEAYEPFARRLFHPAFASCINADVRDQAVVWLQEMLAHGALEVVQELLNLDEYLDRVNYAEMVFPTDLLMKRSEGCQLYAKALRYAETIMARKVSQFEQSKQVGRIVHLSSLEWEELLKSCEKVIQLSNHLGQRESARGVLRYLQKNYALLTGRSGEFTVSNVDMYAKLQWWSESYRAHEERWMRKQTDLTAMHGMMRALDEMGDISRVFTHWRRDCAKSTKLFSREDLRKSGVADLGAKSAWLLGKWKDLEEAMPLMSDESREDGTVFFFKATSCVQQRRPDEALVAIHEARRQVDASFTALLAESYTRAYSLLVGLQQLSELEEMCFVFKSAGTSTDAVARLAAQWSSRLAAMAPEPTEWQGTLTNHSILIDRHADLPQWLEFVRICTTNGRPKTAEHVLQELLEVDDLSKAATKEPMPPKALVLEAMTYLHRTRDRVGVASRVVDSMQLFTRRIEREGFDASESAVVAQCYARLSQWRSEAYSDAPSRPGFIRDVVEGLRTALRLDDSNAGMWHQWAVLHKSIATTRGTANAETHAIEALIGFVRSARLTVATPAVGRECIQDLLGFLSLWFMFGGAPAVDERIHDLIEQVPVQAWIDVVPQLIARLHTQRASVTASVHALLTRVAKHHPQALLYPLQVSLNSPVTEQDLRTRKAAAAAIMENLRADHGEEGGRLKAQAELVSQELIRCAVPWPQLWSVELSAAYQAWEVRHDMEEVFVRLNPLLENMRAPSTESERHFVGDFGKMINEAVECFMQYRETQDDEDAARGWQKFTHLHDLLERQMAAVTSVLLHYVSPNLMQVSRGPPLSLCVPGQYRPLDRDFPRIAAFDPSLKVLPSKQRPRRIKVVAHDGRGFNFLLKGMEDLRQDERVMQLIGLTNTLLENNTSTARKDFVIARYSVIPLSDNAGLIQWLDNTETINQVVRDYRERERLQLELAVVADFFTTDRDKCDVPVHMLSLSQRLEVFETMLNVTEGADLARMMWVRSPSAEVWLERRTNFTRSLAAMSMLGYVLGLGDRHPGNLMLHGGTGRVIHVDFGDSFEVAMLRSHYPEQVPFRLTRMLTRAMEVCGIEGLFITSCGAVMRVLREERDCLLTVLEAFVHDPLLTWRLTTTAEPARARNDAAAVVAAAGGHSIIATSMRFAPRGFGMSVAQSVARLPGAMSYSVRARVGDIAADAAAASTRAQEVVQRIQEKLTGMEASANPTTAHLEQKPAAPRSVREQVAMLVSEASSAENLSQMYHGWCAFW